MNNEQRLESVVGFYRQKLADEQLLVANLTVRINELDECVGRLEAELEGYRVPKEPEQAIES